MQTIEMECWSEIYGLYFIFVLFAICVNGEMYSPFSRIVWELIPRACVVCCHFDKNLFIFIKKHLLLMPLLYHKNEKIKRRKKNNTHQHYLAFSFHFHVTFETYTMPNKRKRNRCNSRVCGNTFCYLLIRTFFG